MRKPIFAMNIMAATVLMVGLTAGLEAQAQEGGAGSETYSGGRSVSLTPSCPTIEWHIMPVPRGVAAPINGVAYYTDMSGVSVIKGAITVDGTITSTLTSVSGKGPAGTATGKRSANITHVELNGDGCAKAKFDLQRWSPVGGGGGSAG